MSKVFAEVLFRKISGFCYTQNMRLFWHEERDETTNLVPRALVELFFEVPLSGCSRSTLANRNMFKVDDNKVIELRQLMLYK